MGEERWGVGGAAGGADGVTGRRDQHEQHNSPMEDLRAMAAGPGLENSAAMGPRRLVGVQLPLDWPPICAGEEKKVSLAT